MMKKLVIALLGLGFMWTMGTQVSAVECSSFTKNNDCTANGCQWNGASNPKCQPIVTNICGNGIVGAGEQCDDGNTTTEACAYGLMSCQVCNSTCQLVAGATSYCGNGTTNAWNGETCDDGNTVTETCTYGQMSCTVCNSICQSVAGATSYCGDGTTNAWNGETCDNAGNNGSVCTPTYGGNGCSYCSANCSLVQVVSPYCGDGIQNGGEACDDGNASNTDTCRNDCTLPVCGDQIVSAGETCDDGNTTTEACTYGEMSCEVCDSTCQTVNGATAYCGDSELNGDEACDDGNTTTEACTYGEMSCEVCDSTCQTVNGATSYCGDGELNGDEACDDGNQYNTDECTNKCNLPTCGDGYIQQTNNEVCDDANPNNGDGCSSVCDFEDGFYCTWGFNSLNESSICGDEPCVFGPNICTLCPAGTSSTDGVLCAPCSLGTYSEAGAASCSACEWNTYSDAEGAASCTYCPEGTVVNEQHTACMSVCGNGIATAGEQCDDGNTTTETCVYGEMSCEVCASDCTTTNGVTAYCGDSETNGDETCDDGNTETETCLYGEMSCEVCASDCTTTNGATAYCGDSETNGDEGCDDGVDNGTVCTPTYGGEGCTYCTSECTSVELDSPYCGDGILNGDEVCDSTENCSDQCTCAAGYLLDTELGCVLAPVCGAAMMQDYYIPMTPAEGELCGNGAVANFVYTPQDGWTWECVVGETSVACSANETYCGDGVLNGTETCDAGTANGVACTPTDGGNCTYCSATCAPITLVTMCQVPPGNPQNQHLIYVPSNEVASKKTAYPGLCVPNGVALICGQNTTKSLCGKGEMKQLCKWASNSCVPL